MEWKEGVGDVTQGTLFDVTGGTRHFLWSTCFLNEVQNHQFFRSIKICDDVTQGKHAFDMILQIYILILVRIPIKIPIRIFEKFLFHLIFPWTYELRWNEKKVVATSHRGEICIWSDLANFSEKSALQGRLNHEGDRGWSPSRYRRII